MKKEFAMQLIFGIFGLLAIYHILIITQVIPFDKVWAGRLKSVAEMRSFETFSLFVLVFMFTTFAVKYRQVKKGIENRWINGLIWIFAAFYALNTFGNLFSKNILELIFGTLVTLVLAVLCVVVARKK
ncbi:hypothetical protein O3Q51_15915 [Cryomorphaceae bacterium 1068]|nr:hypothetical protein [Cryomorphaceae bacterium 1068]